MSVQLLYVDKDTSEFTFESFQKLVKDLNYPVTEDETRVTISGFRMSQTDAPSQRGYNEVIDRDGDSLLSFDEFSFWWRQPSRYKLLKSR